MKLRTAVASTGTVGLTALAALATTATPAEAGITGYPAVPTVCAHVAASFWWGPAEPVHSHHFLPGHLCFKSPEYTDGNRRRAVTILYYPYSTSNLSLLRCEYGASKCTALWHSAYSYSASLATLGNCQTALLTSGGGVQGAYGAPRKFTYDLGCRITVRSNYVESYWYRNNAGLAGLQWNRPVQDPASVPVTLPVGG